jgi:hypothetical protein
MERIVVCSTYKAASSSLYDTLLLNNENNYDVRKEHICAPRGDNFTYSQSTPLSKNDKTVILIPIRNQKEVYCSALFQDICNPEYEYSPFHSKENILIWKTRKDKDTHFLQKYTEEYMGQIEKLKEHFFRFDFSIYPYLNNASLLSIFPSMGKIPFKKNGYVIRKYDDKNTLCFMDFRIVGNLSLLQQMMRELSLNINITDLMKSNTTDEKAFASDYTGLKRELISTGYLSQDYYSFLSSDLYEVVE